MIEWPSVKLKEGENPWVSYFKQQTLRKNNCINSISTGMPGCQPKGSKILMADGEWKNIEDIQKGDVVLSPQENGSYLFSKVTDTIKWFSNKNYDVVELNRTKKKLYGCSFNHLIPVYNRIYHHKIKYYTAEDFTKLSDGIKSQSVSFYLKDLDIPILLKRKKKDIPCCYLSSNRIAINTIHSKPGYVYGFTLDSPSSLYITDNFMITHNTGKSWGMIYLLSKADPTFNIERIFFRASKMLGWVKDGNLKKKGMAFMLDEAGIDASNMKWWDQVNRGLNSFFQTSRSSNYIFGMTVPFITLISKGVRNLMNVRFYADGYRNDCTIFKRAFKLEYNDDMDKTYRKKLWVMKTGGGAFCQGLKLPKADAELLKEYERRKEEFKLSTYADVEEKLRQHEVKEKEKTLTGGLTVPQQEHYDLRWAGKTTEEASKIRGVGKRQGQLLEQSIREKGKYFPEDEEIQSKIALARANRGGVRV